MAVPSYGEKLIPFCESKGLREVRRLRHVDNHFHRLDWAGVDNWLLVKDAERSDESLSISRKALFTSRIALMLSITTAITIAVISHFAK